MKFEIITIFPDFFRGPFDFGIIRRAKEAGLVEINIHDLRVFTKDKHRTVDDRPFGGGEGMVLKPEPIFDCVEFLRVTSKAQRDTNRESVILLSPGGRRFDQRMASELVRLERVTVICGRYEGVDERVAQHIADREVSVGDFVLSGGELGAALIVDTVTRLIPGALGNVASAKQESFTADEHVLDGEPDSTCGSGGLLDYPHYTRPADYRGMSVPEALLNGNHDEIRRWRRKEALAKTLRNRPELLDESELSKEDRKLLDELRRELETV
ncbi:MAG TPA: tRNA (guanosine(37)-N1)-methyltransferase TrmD [Terriglobales bacterium]|nr:tRNA (guanosine(37)-N1)-methyltransferase TrmD [Terriglobales bacterium]